jgi:putative hydrolase of HD superfamily
MSIFLSVADHMYRMAMIAMMIPTKGTDRPLDIGRCVQVSTSPFPPFHLHELIGDVQMALVHDLAEAHVGDITPVEGVSAQTKHQVSLFRPSPE